MVEITITPLHPSLGAEVSGVDLSRPIDAPTREALSRALAQHLALVFHGQSLTPEQYLAAAEAFGPPMRQHYSQHHMEGYPDIGLVWHRNGQRPAERWHTDHTNRERPPARRSFTGSRSRRPAAAPASPICARPMTRCRKTNGAASMDCGRSTASISDHTDTRPGDFEKYGKPIVHPMVRTHPVHGSRAVYFHITKAHASRG